jgi:hypothetical protein
MVIDQVRWFQEQGADITVTVADLEAWPQGGPHSREGVKPLSPSTFTTMRH